ncbi:enoyl-CoA hydratase [Stella humosa]|uniref:Enoyl-CoA hydratase n=1 Tax=Stella humosa TaxID=94 RepID=A0A3N1KYP3_9PROT|nr:enoyl-CoA hydratase/isomerase family protein [Stella humosa]ROP83750.1 enoyl-CoA hydratase [Stella humosa]BBK32989.1 enoyl-CoA hydratase [Stella humosa]
MNFERIGYEAADGRATITFRQPDRMNPLDGSTVKELRRAVATAEADPALRAVVITGSGRAFSAGGDLAGYISLYRDTAGFRAFLEDFFELGTAIERSRLVYIAAINGFCVAGGLELMLACDLAIAAREAKIGDGHLNFGQLPGAGGSQRLPRAIGAQRAKLLLLSGRLVDGVEAERIGLVAEAVPLADLATHVDTLVAGLMERSRAGIEGMKHLVNQGLRGSFADGLRMEVDYVHRYATSEPDATEGLVAFQEKRRPRFGA